jgi:hypothetical protein
LSHTCRIPRHRRPTVFCNQKYLVSAPVPPVRLAQAVVSALPCTRSWPHVVLSAVPLSQLVYTVRNAIPHTLTYTAAGTNLDTSCVTHTHGTKCGNTYRPSTQSRNHLQYHARNMCKWNRPRYRLHPNRPEPVPFAMPCPQHMQVVPAQMPRIAHSLEVVSIATLQFQLQAIHLHLVL